MIMIMVDFPVIWVHAWIYERQWMWFLMSGGRQVSWSRLNDFKNECLFFTYCGIGEHA
jgi:hypothetical protein